MKKINAINFFAVLLFLSAFTIICFAGTFDPLPKDHWIRSAYKEINTSLGKKSEIPANTTRFSAAFRLADILEGIRPDLFLEYRRKLAWEFSGELALIQKAPLKGHIMDNIKCLPENRFDRILKSKTKSWPSKNSLPTEIAHFYKIDHKGGKRTDGLCITDISIKTQEISSILSINIQKPDINALPVSEFPSYKLEYDGFRGRIRLELHGIRQDAWFYSRGKIPLGWKNKRYVDPLIDYISILNPLDDSTIWLDIYLSKPVHLNISKKKSPFRMNLEFWEARVEDYRPLWRVKIDQVLEGENLFTFLDEIKYKGFPSTIVSDKNGHSYIELLPAFDTFQEANQACEALKSFGLSASTFEYLYR